MDNWRSKRVRKEEEIHHKQSENNQKKAEENRVSPLPTRQSNVSSYTVSVKAPIVHSSWQPSSSFPNSDDRYPNHKRPSYRDTTSKTKTTGERYNMWGVWCCGSWN